MADRTIMKTLLLLVILGSSEIVAQVPAEIGIVYYQDGSTFQSLIKVTAKRTGRGLGTAEIPGATSALRLPTGQPHTFRVCGVDPTRYKLFVMKSATNARTLDLFKVGAFGGVKYVLVDSEIDVNIQTADGNCFSLTPKKALDAGEYGFSPTGVDDIFAFGVGDDRNSKLDTKLPVAGQGSENQPRSVPSAPLSQTDDKRAALLKVKRIYIDNFGEGSTTGMLLEMLINALSVNKRFTVTENKGNADAVLKGFVDDSTPTTETANTVRLTVRLVSTDGDVIWSTTLESSGSKTKGTSADLADQVAEQLLSNTK